MSRIFLLNLLLNALSIDERLRIWKKEQESGDEKSTIEVHQADPDMY